MTKAGGTGRGIIESGAFVQQFKTSPFPPSLSYMNSPLYMYAMPPYWKNISGTYPNYFTGIGDYLPEHYFSTHRPVSFSDLPAELGGQLPGERGSRFTGTPME